MSQIQVKMRQGGQLKDIPFGCNCNGSGGMDNGELAAVQKELEALGGNIAAVQADLKATQDEQERIRQELERRDKAVVNVYVGGSGAGDSLIDGRGLVPELPFAHLEVAIGQTVMKDRSKYHIFNIQDDLEEDTISLSNGYGIAITRGANLQRNPKIVMQNSMAVGHGYAVLRNVDFENLSNGYVAIASEDGFINAASCIFKGVEQCFAVSLGGCAFLTDTTLEIIEGFSPLYATNLGNIALAGSITINGQCSVASVSIARAARLLVADTSLNFSGDVVGKKYNLNNHSALILNGVPKDSIPGTLAGVCDTSSQVIA